MAQIRAGLQPCFTQCTQGEFQLFGVYRVEEKESVPVTATRNAYCRTEGLFVSCTNCLSSTFLSKHPATESATLLNENTS